MRRALAHVFPLALGAALGLLLTSVTVEAQGAPKFHADVANNCQWSQPAADLATASTLKITASVNGQPAVPVTVTCTGSASPFTCQYPVPLALQPVGVDTLVTNGATVDPVDGSLSAVVTLVTVQYEIVPPVQPPLPGSNGRFLKIVGGLVAALVGLLTLFGHH